MSSGRPRGGQAWRSSGDRGGRPEPDGDTGSRERLVEPETGDFEAYGDEDEWPGYQAEGRPGGAAGAYRGSGAGASPARSREPARAVGSVPPVRVDHAGLLHRGPARFRRPAPPRSGSAGPPWPGTSGWPGPASGRPGAAANAGAAGAAAAAYRRSSEVRRLNAQAPSPETAGGRDSAFIHPGRGAGVDADVRRRPVEPSVAAGSARVRRLPRLRLVRRGTHAARAFRGSGGRRRASGRRASPRAIMGRTRAVTNLSGLILLTGAVVVVVLLAAGGYVLFS